MLLLLRAEEGDTTVGTVRVLSPVRTRRTHSEKVRDDTFVYNVNETHMTLRKKTCNHDFQINDSIFIAVMSLKGPNSIRL